MAYASRLHGAPSVANRMLAVTLGTSPGLVADRIVALAAITRTFAAVTADLDHVLRVVVTQTARFLDGYAMLGLVSRDGLWWEGRAVHADGAAMRSELEELLGPHWPIDGPAIPAAVVRTGNAVLVGDLGAAEQKFTRPPRHIAFIERYDAKGLACVPMRSQGRVIGTLSFGRFGRNAPVFERGDLELLQILADHAAQAIASSRLLGEIQTSAARSRGLVEVIRTFAQTGGDYDRLLNVIVEQASTFMDGLCTLGIIAPDRVHWDSLTAFSSNTELLRDRNAAVPPQKRRIETAPVLGDVARTGKLVLIDDLKQVEWEHPPPPALLDLVSKYNMRGMVVVPMRAAEGLCGALAITRHGTAPRSLEPADVDLLQVLADHAAQTIASARHLDAVRRELAEHQRTRLSLERAEEQIRQAAKMEAVGRLAGGIAHDFNNLLTVVLGETSLLKRELESGSPLRQSIDEIHRAGESASQLTQQLLAFSRQQVLEPHVLCLNAVVAHVETLLGRLVGENIRLSIVAQPDLWSCRVDPSQVEQIVMNLVINARDAMPLGGSIDIEMSNVELDEAYVSSHPDASVGAHVVLSISDNGVGMDPHTLSRIFEPFFTTKPKGVGTGLGLATVYGIAKQSGGSVHVDSSLGLGTTFKIYFPRVDPLQSTTARRVIHREACGGSEAVLVVEDQEPVRRLIVKVLEQAGYFVCAASSGREALRLWDEYGQRFSLLVTDMVMPEMDGQDLAERLRKSRPTLKVVYMSGYTTRPISQDATHDPDAQFLPKPFATEALLSKVRQLLD